MTVGLVSGLQYNTIYNNQKCDRKKKIRSKMLREKVVLIKCLLMSYQQLLLIDQTCSLLDNDDDNDEK